MFRCGDEHDRVRPGRRGSVAGPVVVPDDEGVRRRAGLGDVEALRGLGRLHAARREGVRVLVRVEECTAEDPHHDRDDERDDEEDDVADDAPGAALPLGLLVARDRAQGTRRKNGSAVAVADCDSADSSLESSAHGF